MTRDGAEEYITAIRTRYWAAGKVEKGRILDEACQTTGFHRKAMIRLLRGTRARVQPAARRPKYGADLIEPLVVAWEAMGRPCATRLEAFLPELIPALERHGELQLPDEWRALLLEASPSTIQRLLAQHRRRLVRQPRTSSHLLAQLRDEVPLRTFSEWVNPEPGALQADLVAHCGESTQGFYLCTLQMVDVATSWTVLEAVWGKGQQRVGSGIHRGRLRLPFSLTGLHTDNGGEFINHGLVGWCRREGIKLTRGRPYRKNDQAFAEQRNWVAVRRVVGYGRYSSREAHVKMRQLYALLELDLNLFQPVQKLTGKSRSGARVTRHYDRPQTPLQRALAAGVLDETTATRLRRQFEATNPAALRRRIEMTLVELWKLTESPVPSVTEPVTHHPSGGNHSI